ncbi:hypothetical protein GCM10011418_19100 [Sphingobacterium alkalisoli]|nr:hypothetical protein GCM10011418_19100 [Sphingobacterium alkalisoli]
MTYCRSIESYRLYVTSPNWPVSMEAIAFMDPKWVVATTAYLYWKIPLHIRKAYSPTLACAAMPVESDTAAFWK